MRASTGTRVIWIVVSLLLGIAPVFTALPAQIARAAEPSCEDVGNDIECTYSYTGAAQTWIVPDWVTTAQFDVYGASGGNIGTFIYGGKGGHTKAALLVTPGDTITIMVGGKGQNAGETNLTTCQLAFTTGGFNGGGNSGTPTGSPPCPGGGGGGASDIRIGGTDLASRVIVAGGGGGAANLAAFWGNATGGAGGGDVGERGGYVYNGNAYGGRGGNQDCSQGSGQAGVGSAGASTISGSGGGGGGGWCGGAGGHIGSNGDWYGGGGGSGHSPGGVPMETGVNSGDGKVVVRFNAGDETPPTTTATYSNGYVPGTWSNQPVTVTLSGTDNRTPSDQLYFFYGVDDIDCTNHGVTRCAQYFNPITISTEGTHAFDYLGLDSSGNVDHQHATINIDLTDPTVNYSGNAGTYRVDQQIDITCTATDSLSGISNTTCQNISGPAWSFGLGTHSYTATATDLAGNVASDSTAFTVGVSYDSLANLTCQLVTQRTICNALNYNLASAEWAEGRHIGLLQQHHLNLYSSMAKALSGRILTSEQAQFLIDTAALFYPSRR
ncbi:MAG: glycine-rich protein [Thermomicrobiales bacterium]|nr:glycine-rich protein [Thermomicrobiales bacterium]